MNLPNKLTVLRMVLIPFVMFFYLATFIPHGIGKIVALVIFILAALTDLLDGKIARKHNLVTNLGKFLDPIADKILTASVLFMIMADGTIPAPYGVIIVTIIIAREFMVSALRLIAASQGTVLAADIWGKAKTMVQMIAIPFVLIYPLIFPDFSKVFPLEIFLCYVAAITSLLSGVIYFIQAKDVVLEGATK